MDEDVIDAELEYAKKKILFAPHSLGPYPYAASVYRIHCLSLGLLRCIRAGCRIRVPCAPPPEFPRVPRQVLDLDFFGHRHGIYIPRFERLEGN